MGVVQGTHSHVSVRAAGDEVQERIVAVGANNCSTSRNHPSTEASSFHRASFCGLSY